MFFKGGAICCTFGSDCSATNGPKKLFLFFFFELFHKEIVFRYSLTITYGFFLLIESNFTDVIIVWFFF